MIKPESLATTFGSRAGQRNREAHGSTSPDAIGGLPRWSSTKVSSGTARTVSAARVVTGVVINTDGGRAPC